MKHFFSTTIHLCLLLCAICSSRTGQVAHAAPYMRAEAPAAAPQPYFLENKGQITNQDGHTRHDIDFSIATNKGLNVFVGQGKIVYQWHKATAPLNAAPGKPAWETDNGPVQFYRMEMSLAGANPKATLQKEQKSTYFERYITATAKNAKAEAFGRITYKNVYPNIDWVLYYAPNGLLEYDFIVHPGGHIADIRLEFGGATNLQLDPAGGLIAGTPMGQVYTRAPYCYDQDGYTVNSTFALQDNQLRFKTGAYSGRLIIDPIQEWGSYFGGEAADYQGQIRSNGSTCIYMGGHTRSTRNIATTGAWQTAITGTASANNHDLFIVKMDSTGKRIWSTYYGGDKQDYARSLALDPWENIYLVGYGASTQLGTPGVHQQDTFVNDRNFEGYLAKFDSSGKRLWHTYYGGPLQDVIAGVACDVDGYVYITGETVNITYIASPGSFQPAAGLGSEAFLAKFDSSGKRVWGTYFGSEGADYGYNVTCAPDKSVYICGRTGSRYSIATTGAHLTQNMGATISGFFYGYAAYLAKFTPSGERIWATYYSGGMAEGTAVVCDAYHNVYMAGRTVSDSLYTASPGSHQQQAGSFQDGDGFLVKFDSAGVRHWGTYYGGNRSEDAIRIDCNSQYVYIAGTTASDDGIATADAPYPNYNDSCTRAGCLPDVFIAKFDTAGSRLWATYYGTKLYDYQASIATDEYGNFYVGGTTNSPDNIAMGEVHQDTISSAGTYDAFLLKFYDCPAAPAAPENIVGNDTICAGSIQSYTIESQNNLSYNWQLPDGWTGDTTGSSITLQAGRQEGLHHLQLRASAYCEKRRLTSTTKGMDIYIPAFPTPTITVEGYKLSTSIAYNSYQWLKNGAPISGATQDHYEVPENGEYAVAVTDAFGCTDTSDVYSVSNVSVNEPALSKDIRVYPNPAKETIYIEAPEQAWIILSTLDGREIQRHKGGGLMSVQQLPEGIYMLRIVNIPGRDNGYQKLVIAGR